MDGDQRLEVEKQACPFRVFDAPNTKMFVQKNEKPCFYGAKKSNKTTLQQSRNPPKLQQSRNPKKWKAGR